MPAISVIVPVYCAQDTLQRCVDSVLAQSFTDFELILVNDGSTDNSGKICDAYAAQDSRVRVIHQKNRGPSAARNRGMKNASGDYIGFVDSDDCVAADFLMTLWKTAAENSADISMCGYIAVYENGGREACCHTYPNGTVFDRRDIEKRLYADIFYNRNTVGYFSLWNKLFKRSLIAGNGLLIDEAMYFGEDMIFVMDCLRHCGRLAFSDKTPYEYESLPTGLFQRYRRRFTRDIMHCYTALIAQTSPRGCTAEDLVPLSVKYWFYINRQLLAVPKNETHKNREIRRILSHPIVKNLCAVLARMPEEAADAQGISQYELTVARLVRDNKMIRAVLTARYQYDDSFWLRKVKRKMRH